MAERSTKPFTPRLSKVRTYRDDLAGEWHRFKNSFTRENIVSNLKTLAWVVPLTLLIWIYAEREQVATTKDEPVPFELQSVDPNRIVSLKQPQDKNFMLELLGPQARLQDVLNKLRGGVNPQGLKIEVPNSYEVNREHGLDTLAIVRNQRIFIDNGITVVACQPPRLQIKVDEVVEREAKIVRPVGAKNVVATFDPPKVKIRGPLATLTQIARQSDAGLLTVYADLPAEELKTPGHKENVAINLITLPPELQDDRVTISNPPPIKATIDVRQADKTLLIRSMPVTVDIPEVLGDKYDVVDFSGVLQNVTVTGPPETIDLMQKPDFEPKPKARVIITPQDVGERRTKPVKFDLPDDVTVSEGDRNLTVQFRLVERANATGL